MSIIRFRVLLLIAATFVMLGCRQYNLYQYKPVTLDVLGGDLVVTLEGTYGENYEEGGKKYADFGAPYSLIFGLELPYEFDLVEFRVTDIELVGEKSEKRLSVPDNSRTNIRDPRKLYDPDATTRTVIMSIGNLSVDGLEYESYYLTANVAVFEDDGSLREEPISIRLQTDFRRDRRSDWFDENMSI